MLDEVLPGEALLSLMGGLGERVRSLDLSLVDLGVAGLDGLDQGIEGVGRPVGRPEREAGEDAAPAFGLRGLLLLQGSSLRSVYRPRIEGSPESWNSVGP
jgi:hypothetical protein